MRRGDLVTVALQGEHGKPRPALVIQSDLFAQMTSSVAVALLTRIDHQSLCMGMGSMVYERVIRHLHIQEFPSPWLHSVHHSN